MNSTVLRDVTNQPAIPSVVLFNIMTIHRYRSLVANASK